MDVDGGSPFMPEQLAVVTACLTAADPGLTGEALEAAALAMCKTQQQVFAFVQPPMATKQAAGGFADSSKLVRLPARFEGISEQGELGAVSTAAGGRLPGPSRKPRLSAPAAAVRTCRSVSCTLPPARAASDCVADRTGRCPAAACTPLPRLTVTGTCQLARCLTPDTPQCDMSGWPTHPDGPPTAHLCSLTGEPKNERHMACAPARWGHPAACMHYYCWLLDHRPN
jgi:hypothetical protein